MPADVAAHVEPHGPQGAQTGASVDYLTDLPCGVVAFADDGRILAANAALGELLGYAPGELEGRHVESILTIAGRIFYQTHLFPLLRLHGGAKEIFLLLRHRAGDDVGVLANAVRTRQDGLWVTRCVLLEVRERRKFEDELLRARRAAESANAALAARGRELEEANERLARQARELLEQQHQLEEQATELEAQQLELQQANLVLVNRSEEVERARALAEEASRAKSQFLATMSHELRTPLNAIGGYVQLIELGIHGPVTDEQAEALQRIGRSQRHLLRLVNDVLNLARIEAGRVEYAIEDVPVASLIASVTPMLEPQMAAARLSFASEVEDGLVARGDRDKVQQILINLLTNAVKFTLAGGRVVLAGRRDATGERVELSVADTGIGVPAEKLAGIFEPFVQVDVGHARRAEGTGLGLAISRDLARGMGGDLSVASQLGVGSTFTLTLARG